MLSLPAHSKLDRVSHDGTHKHGLRLQSPSIDRPAGLFISSHLSLLVLAATSSAIGRVYGGFLVLYT